jgi:hypothetical protein
MATAERMAESIRVEGQGIVVLLWDAKEDLVRALVVINAVLNDLPRRSLLLTPGDVAVRSLRQLIETRVVISPEDPDGEQAAEQPARELWFLYLQQASSEMVGPWLNGWRGPLRQSPGTILLIRHADFEPFQRSAPDLASFVGPRIYNASTMLSVVSRATFERLDPRALARDAGILSQLPGTMPEDSELDQWIAACSPANDE